VGLFYLARLFVCECLCPSFGLHSVVAPSRRYRVDVSVGVDDNDVPSLKLFRRPKRSPNFRPFPKIKNGHPEVALAEDRARVRAAPVRESSGRKGPGVADKAAPSSPPPGLGQKLGQESAWLVATAQASAQVLGSGRAVDV